MCCGLFIYSIKDKGGRGKYSGPKMSLHTLGKKRGPYRIHEVFKTEEKISPGVKLEWMPSHPAKSNTGGNYREKTQDTMTTKYPTKRAEGWGPYSKRIQADWGEKNA